MAQEEIPDGRAAELALKYAMGGASALCALSQTGAILPGIAAEIEAAREGVDAAGRAELDDLARYVRGGHPFTATRPARPDWPRAQG